MRGPPNSETKVPAPLLCSASPRSPAQEMNMPGVEFNVLRAEVRVDQVLNQLNYRATSTCRLTAATEC